MATIQKYKTKSGFRWRVRWTDDSEKQKSKTFDRQSLAKDYLIKIENEHRQGYYISPEKIKLSDFINIWLTNHKKRITENTLRSYLVPIKHINTHIGLNQLQRISSSDIDNMYTNLQSSLSGTSLLYIHRILTIIFKDAEKRNLISRNPCNYVTAPKKNTSKAKIIPPNDVDKYLSAFSKHYLFCAVCLALFCGLRNSEVISLQWNNINFKKMILTVDHSIYWKNSKEYKIVPTKNKEKRIIPLTPGIVKILKQQKKKQYNFQQLYLNKYIYTNFVVTKPDGNLIQTRTLSKEFSRHLVRNELEHVRFHDLRHSFASLLLMEGEQLKSISSILGHSTIQITADTYIHLVDEYKRKSVNKLDKYLNSSNF